MSEVQMAQSLAGKRILLIVGAGLGATLLRARNTPKDAQHSVQES